MKQCIAYTFTHEGVLERNFDLIRFSSSRRWWVLFGKGQILVPLLCFICLLVIFFCYENNFFNYFGKDYGFILDLLFASIYSGAISAFIYWVISIKKSKVIRDILCLAKEVAVEPQKVTVLFAEEYIQVDFDKEIKKTLISEITSVQVWGGTIIVYSNRKLFFMFPRCIQNHDMVDYFPKEKLKVKPKANYNIKRTYKPTIEHEKFPYQL